MATIGIIITLVQKGFEYYDVFSYLFHSYGVWQFFIDISVRRYEKCLYACIRAKSPQAF